MVVNHRGGPLLLTGVTATQTRLTSSRQCPANTPLA